MLFRGLDWADNISLWVVSGLCSFHTIFYGIIADYCYCFYIYFHADTIFLASIIVTDLLSIVYCLLFIFFFLSRGSFRSSLSTPPGFW